MSWYPNAKSKSFKDYAHLSGEDLDGIVEKYKELLLRGYPLDQAISCTAADYFRLTDRQWNGVAGANAFAAVCATLVLKKVLKLELA